MPIILATKKVAGTLRVPSAIDSRSEPATFVAVALGLLVSLSHFSLLHFAVAGENFRVVNLPPKQSATYDRAAEDAYRQLSTWWFGKPHPDLWRPESESGKTIAPVPITIRLQRNSSAGGATTFRIERGHVFGWRMTVVGTRERILADAIPHEVGHVVFYSRFRRPLGRCLDEGTAMIGESPREHAVYRKRVAAVLAQRRIIRFKTFLDEPRYPRNRSTVMTMYAQSHSLVEFLLQRNGRRRFVSFLEDRRKPTVKLRDFYGIDADRLHAEWEAWFRLASRRGHDCVSFGCPFHAAAKPRSNGNHRTATQPVIYAFTADWCKACRPFKRDVAAGKFPGYRFVFVDPDSDRKRWTEITKKMTDETGHHGGVPLPSWWVPGSKKLTVMKSGYSAPGLLQILGGVVRGLIRFLHNPELEPDGTSPQGMRSQGNGIPVPSGSSGGSAATEDWGGITIVLLVAEQDAGVVRGKIRRALIGLSRGPLQRKARELTGGEAVFQFVAERTQPQRYQALLRAAGLEPAPFEILVLVPRQNRGLIKGSIVKRVERIVEGKLKSRPNIEVLFQRTHPTDFDAVRAALRFIDDSRPTTAISKSETGNGIPLTRATLKQELLTFGNQFVRKEVEAAVVAKLTGGPVPDTIQELKQTIVFWMVSLGLPLWLVERMTKNHRLKKQVKQAWQRLRSSSAASSPSSDSGESPASSPEPSLPHDSDSKYSG